VRLQLFGAPALLGGEHGGPLAQDRMGQMALLLALRRDWTARELLSTHLWPEADAASARRNLRKLLFRARQQPWLEALECRGDLLRWCVDSDLEDFESACRASDWATAVAAYRGALAEGFEQRAAAPLAEWLYFERQRLAALFRTAAAQRFAQLGDRAAAGEALARQWLAADPHDEDALAALVSALRALGRDGDAWRSAREFAERAERELGVAPSARVQALIAPAAETRAPLAPERDGLVGRRIELREVAQMLQRPELRLLSLLGPGGIGKSRLARAAIAPLGEHFDAVHWIALEDLADIAQLPARLAQAIGGGTAGTLDPLQQVCAAIGAKRLLIVFDGAEHLGSLAELCAQLLAQTPAVKLLVTTRARLAIPAEHLLPLAGLPVPDADETEAAVLRAYDAVKLFEQRARILAPAFDAAAQAPQVARLVRRLGGAPLAIELAAAWAHVLPVADIEAEIGQSLDLLEGSAGLPERQRSARASFAHSWRLLSAIEQRALAELSVFAGPFGRDAARQVAHAPLPLLAGLVDKSLIVAHDGGGFAFHALVQQAAREHLADEASTRTRHAEYFVRLLDSFGDSGALMPSALAEVEAMLEDCLAAWRLALARGQLGWIETMAPMLGSFFTVKGRLREGVALFDGALRALPPAAWAQRGALAAVLRGLGTLEYHHGRSGEAVAHIREALRLYRGMRRHLEIMKCLLVLGLLYWQRAEQRTARQCFAESLRLSEGLDDAVMRAQPMAGLAMCEKQTGNFARAIELYEGALALYRRAGHGVGEVRTLNNLGNTYRSMRRWADATRHLEACLEAAARHGVSSVHAYCWVNLGLIEAAQGHADAAERWFAKALDDETKLGEGLAASDLRQGLGRVAVLRGDLALARRRLHEALVRACGRGHLQDMLSALVYVGEWLATSGERARALALWRFVQQHAATEHLDAEEARTLVARLAPGTAELRQARLDAAALELDAATRSLIAELA
jgi:predicted ATPase/Tfp pilus assembly protein PilF